MITHVVLFKLKDRTIENMQNVREKLMSMEGKIPQLRHIEVGVDVVRSQRSYDIALITKFNSLSDLEEYQIHPVHVEVSDFITSVRELSVSVDYES